MCQWGGAQARGKLRCTHNTATVNERWWRLYNPSRGARSTRSPTPARRFSPVPRDTDAAQRQQAADRTGPHRCCGGRCCAAGGGVTGARPGGRHRRWGAAAAASGGRRSSVAGGGGVGVWVNGQTQRWPGAAPCPPGGWGRKVGGRAAVAAASRVPPRAPYVVTAGRCQAGAVASPLYVAASVPKHRERGPLQRASRDGRAWMAVPASQRSRHSTPHCGVLLHDGPRAGVHLKGRTRGGRSVEDVLGGRGT